MVAELLRRQPAVDFSQRVVVSADRHEVPFLAPVFVPVRIAAEFIEGGGHLLDADDVRVAERHGDGTLGLGLERTEHGLQKNPQSLVHA